MHFYPTASGKLAASPITLLYESDRRALLRQWRAVQVGRCMDGPNDGPHALRALWTGTTTCVLKPQRISSAVQCSRAERGSESCGLVYSRCPYIERINSSHRYQVPVNLPKGTVTGTEMPMLDGMLNYNDGSRSGGSPNLAKVMGRQPPAPIRMCMHTVGIHDTGVHQDGLRTGLRVSYGPDCCH